MGSSSFILPDLFSYCQYPLTTNVHCASVARASEDWLLKDANFALQRQAAFRRLHAGELTAMCYPNTDVTRLKDVADFLNFLFTLDDWSDEFNAQDTVGLADSVMGALWDPEAFITDKAAGKLAKSFSGRFRLNAGPGCRRRFIETMDLFFRAVAQQARDRARGDVPSLEDYITLRMDTSGCKPCFALIEYAAGIDLPDQVVAHSVVRALEEAANSHIAWSNDLFSYDVEQARGDTHNMIQVVMQRHDFSLQTAVDYVGDLTNASIARFEEVRRNLPSWGGEIDRDVALYIQGLQDWMVGALHWSFNSARYFGDNGLAVKQHRVVTLRPNKGIVEPHDAFVPNKWTYFLMKCTCIPAPKCRISSFPSLSSNRPTSNDA